MNDEAIRNQERAYHIGLDLGASYKRLIAARVGIQEATDEVNQALLEYESARREAAKFFGFDSIKNLL
jgi:hypothetical protein